ncbi:MAG TPA: ABC transporter substrate-binding protein [Acidimicrobiales bacterium]|nr:ABC transporter substrate-binding protein [Acidimicrobiales bacterium]
MKRFTVAVVLLALMSGGCAAGDDTAGRDSGPTTRAGPPSLLVAVGGPFSGEAKAVGDQIRAGARLAADQVNAAGGIADGPLKGRRVELDGSFDDGNDPHRALESLLRAVDDARYVAFVGSARSDAALAAAGPASEAGLSYLAAFATSPEVLRAARAQKSVFVLPPTTAASALSVTEQLLKSGHRRPAVIHTAGDGDGDGDGVAQVVERHLQERSFPAVAVEPYTPADTDFTAQLERIRAADPDSLLMIGEARSEAAIVRQAAQIGLAATAFDAAGVAAQLAFLTQAGDLANGVVGASPTDVPRGTPAAKALREAYTAATGDPALPLAAAFAYEGMQAVAAGFAHGATGRLDLSDHLHEIALADTGVGPLKFSPDGSRIGGRLTVFTIANGTPVARAGYEQTGPAAVREVALER